MSAGKVGKVKTSGRAVDYIFKKHNECERQPKIIGGNVLGKTKKEIKKEFREQEKLNLKVINTITHFSISFPVGEDVSDEDAADYADELMRELGYDKNLYIVVRHFDKEDREKYPFGHIHIVASRIKDDSTLVPEWEIADRTIEATKKLDVKFNLESVEYVKLSAAEKSERNIKKGEYQMMSRTGKLSVLEEFKDCAEASLSERSDVQKFVKDVQAAGFEVLPNVSSETGEMRGFSFSKNGIVFTAKRAGNKFKWANLSKELDYQPVRDTKFLQQLKAEVLAKKELEKQPKKIIETVKIVEEGTEHEATRKRHTIGQTTGIQTTVEEKSDSQTKIFEVEKSPRIESGSGLAETPFGGAKSSQVWDNRTNDTAARSRQEIAGNDAENFIATERNEETDTDAHSESERGTDRRSERSRQFARDHRRVEIGKESGAKSESQRGTGIRSSNEEIPKLSNVVRRNKSGDGEGVENSENFGSRLSNRNQQSAQERGNTFTESSSEAEKSYSYDSATNSGSDGLGDFGGKDARETERETEKAAEIVTRAINARTDHHGDLFFDEEGLERGLGAGKTNDGSVKSAPGSISGKHLDDEAELRPYNHDAQANITGGTKILQSTTAGTNEDYTNDREANRRTAEKTAQIINVKRFSGLLDPQIIAEWTAIIERSGATEFLNEIVAPKNQEQQQKIFQQFDKQAEHIADKFKLPKPEPQLKTDPRKLAWALTKIDVAGFEKASGEQVKEKTFEALVEINVRRSDAPPLPEQLEQIQENNSGLAKNLNISSNLEAETLNALLDLARVGFDAETISRTQRYVETNEAAAREMTTLVQIAYGGQQDKFTGDFKSNLAEQIYRSPAPAIDVYQDFKQLDWQKTIEAFAPVVNSIAEQSKLEIKPPADNGDRNRLLADFISEELIRNCESRNTSLEQYVQKQIFNSFMKASNLNVDESQKETIDQSLDKNLESPEFSSSLEASAYNSTKYDDDKKAEFAVRMADQIREEAKIKALKEIDIVEEREEALTMG